MSRFAISSSNDCSDDMVRLLGAVVPSGGEVKHKGSESAVVGQLRKEEQSLSRADSGIVFTGSRADTPEPVEEEEEEVVFSKDIDVQLHDVDTGLSQYTDLSKLLQDTDILKHLSTIKADLSTNQSKSVPSVPALIVNDPATISQLILHGPNLAVSKLQQGTDLLIKQLRVVLKNSLSSVPAPIENINLATISQSILLSILLAICQAVHGFEDQGPFAKSPSMVNIPRLEYLPKIRNMAKTLCGLEKSRLLSKMVNEQAELITLHKIPAEKETLLNDCRAIFKSRLYAMEDIIMEDSAFRDRSAHVFEDMLNDKSSRELHTMEDMMEDNVIDHSSHFTNFKSNLLITSREVQIFCYITDFTSLVHQSNKRIGQNDHKHSKLRSFGEEPDANSYSSNCYDDSELSLCETRQKQKIYNRVELTKHLWRVQGESCANHHNSDNLTGNSYTDELSSDSTSSVKGKSGGMDNAIDNGKSSSHRKANKKRQQDRETEIFNYRSDTSHGSTAGVLHGGLAYVPIKSGT